VRLKSNPGRFWLITVDPSHGGSNRRCLLEVDPPPGGGLKNDAKMQKQSNQLGELLGQTIFKRAAQTVQRVPSGDSKNEPVNWRVNIAF